MAKKNPSTRELPMEGGGEMTQYQRPDGTWSFSPDLYSDDPDTLFYDLRQFARCSFFRITDFDSPKISEFLSFLPKKKQRQGLQKLIDDRREVVLERMSPGGIWYLFTLSEGFDLSLRSRDMQDRERDAEIEFFFSRFLLLWSEDGERKFTDVEADEFYKRSEEHGFRNEGLEPKRPRDEWSFYRSKAFDDMLKYGEYRSDRREMWFFPDGFHIDLKEADNLFRHFKRLRELGMNLLGGPSELATSKITPLAWKAKQVDLAGIIQCLNEAGYLQAMDKEVVQHFDYESTAKDRVDTLLKTRWSLRNGHSHMDKARLQEFIKLLQRYL